jgi:hypothetical protein
VANNGSAGDSAGPRRRLLIRDYCHCYPHPNGAEPYLSEGFASTTVINRGQPGTTYRLLRSVGARLQNFSKKSKVSVLLEDCEYVSSSDTLDLPAADAKIESPRSTGRRLRWRWYAPPATDPYSYTASRPILCAADIVSR